MLPRRVLLRIFHSERAILTPKISRNIISDYKFQGYQDGPWEENEVFRNGYVHSGVISLDQYYNLSHKTFCGSRQFVMTPQTCLKTQRSPKKGMADSENYVGSSLAIEESNPDF